MKKGIRKSILLMGVLVILMVGLLSGCGRTTAEDIHPSGEEETAEPVKTDPKYPGANNRMVYIPLEEPVLWQWSLDGKKKKEIHLPLEKYGGTDEYSLLWVGNDELLWSVYVEDEGDVSYMDRILSTPLRWTGSEEEVLMDETEELFILKEEDDISIGGMGDFLEEPGITYVDKTKIMFFYDGVLYKYDRTSKKGPVPVGKENSGTISSVMMKDKVIYHTGITPGKPEIDSYEFWIYDLTAGKRKSIDSRCCNSAAYVADPARDRVYYQIIDDQGIWEYDSVQDEKRELISEKDLQACYQQNQLPWDGGSYDDLFFMAGDKLYYIRNSQAPMLFSYSFTDAVLSFEKEITEVLPHPEYLEDVEIVKYNIVGNKLLVYMRDGELDAYYFCIDLQTAERKAVTKTDPEIIYFGMPGEWYADDTLGNWDKKAGKEEKKQKGGMADAGRAETVEEQIGQISSHASQWMKTDEGGFFYAVTDLDHNGRLEVIVSSGPQGSGGYTRSEYYQLSMDNLSMDRSKLQRIHTEGGSGDADIVNQIDTAYWDPGTDTYYYCIQDYASGGAGARYIWYGTMFLKDGLLTDRTYASGECTWNKKKTKEVWHYSCYGDGKEQKIKKKKLDAGSLAEEFLGGFEKKKVSVSWFYDDGDKKLPEKKIKKLLMKSYKKFSVR